MSDIDNPPAFPRTGEGFGNPKYDKPGMTLRDWFAGQAAMGLMSACDNAGTWTTMGCAGGVAQHAYQVADAMLIERTKEASQ